MPTVADIGYGFLAPAGVAAIVFMLARLCCGDTGRRIAPAVAVVAGFLTGYGLLGLGPIRPNAHWEWIPYAALLTLAVGPSSCATTVAACERLFYYLAASVVLAHLLVPNWENLEPSATVYIIAWTFFAGLLAWTLEPLSNRCSPLLYAIVLTGTAVCCAVVLVLSGSLRFGQIAGSAAGALTGLSLVLLLVRSPALLTGIGFSFAVLIAGALLVGRVHSFSDVPLASYLLIPLAPLFLWVAALPPVSRLTGWRFAATALAFPIAACGLAVALAAFAEFAEFGSP